MVPVRNQNANCLYYLVATYIKNHHLRSHSYYCNKRESFVVKAVQTLDLETTLSKYFALVLQNWKLVLRLQFVLSYMSIV